MKYLLFMLCLFVMLTLAPAITGAQSDIYAENKALQFIRQMQGTSQLGICLSGIDTFVSCNNLKAQTQQNSGSNAAGQQGGSGKGGGNSID